MLPGSFEVPPTAEFPRFRAEGSGRFLPAGLAPLARQGLRLASATSLRGLSLVPGASSIAVTA
jgi:hypothetical protein